MAPLVVSRQSKFERLIMTTLPNTEDLSRFGSVARTIADLEGKEKASAEHLAEAFSYRLKEIF